MRPLPPITTIFINLSLCCRPATRGHALHKTLQARGCDTNRRAVTKSRSVRLVSSSQRKEPTMFPKQQLKYVAAFLIGSLSYASVSAYIAPSANVEQARVVNRPDVANDALFKDLWGDPAA